MTNLSSKIGSGGHNIKEYYVTTNMAKELGMVENNKNGRIIRQYFLKCEEELKKITLWEARQIAKRGELEWKQIRDSGKFVRREETDIIKSFVEYATEQGSSNAEWYYKNLTSGDIIGTQFPQNLPKGHNDPSVGKPSPVGISLEPNSRLAVI